MNILDNIGNTPLLQIDNIYFKMEMFNPTGSIKDRIAKAMILDFVQNKRDSAKYTIVEATSGNTGVSVAMVCATLGLKCRIYTPKNTSRLKVKMMRAYGADVVAMHDTIADCIEYAKTRNIISGYHYLDQFNNQINMRAQQNMAQEAQYQLGYANFGISVIHPYSAPYAIVVGVGTGGTLMGLHTVFPDAKIFTLQIPDKEHIEGICDGVKLPLIPKELRINTINVSYMQAKLTAKWLAEKHGIHCGISSGANFFASSIIQRKYKRVLTVFPDSGDRYL